MAHNGDRQHAQASARRRAWGGWASIAASGLMLSATGCMGKLSAPISELPRLRTAVVEASPNWPVIKTRGGSNEQIIGTVTQIDVHHTQNGVDTIKPPFLAVVEGSELKVSSLQASKTYALANVPHFEVTYEDDKATRTATGLGLLGVGVPVLIMALTVSAETKPEPSTSGSNSIAGAFENTAKDTAAATAWGLITVLGVGALVPGLILIASNPSKPKPRKLPSMKLEPTLHVGPSGASLRMKF
ncbi:MAG: hypothetical protein IPM54_28325 [Polyangiaceae bacterium]|nr:hypothetical protein [Polyangiaceae bacterium]